MSSTNEKPIRLVAAEEVDKISRNVLIWLNKFPDIPADVLAGNPLTPINFEFLNADVPGMALYTIPGTAIIGTDILGRYKAQYQFKIAYRTKLGITESVDKRLKANELLDRMGDWATLGKPDLGKGIKVVKVEKAVPAYTDDPKANGDVDSNIIMKMTYEVI